MQWERVRQVGVKQRAKVGDLQEMGQRMRRPGGFISPECSGHSVSEEIHLDRVLGPAARTKGGAERKARDSEPLRCTQL